MRGALSLGLSAVRATGAIGVDAIADLGGRSLPSTPEELARPEVLGPLLGRGITGARLTGVDFPSSNCRNFLVEVEELDGSLRSVYAKLPTGDFGARLFANIVGYWDLECRFSRDVAPTVPVRVPEVYAVHQRRSRFVLLLEDLHELPGARLFVNQDVLAGVDLDRARRCLSAFAELHAHFHDWERDRREALVPWSTHSFASPRGRALSPALNRAAIRRAAQRAPEVVDEHLAATYTRTLDNWDAMLDLWYSGPLTLVHGDSHLGNTFEYDDGTGIRVGLLDFQGVHWAPGIRDITYFLVNSLDHEHLAEHEQGLVDHYLAELATRGVELDRDETWRLYRSFAFQVLVVGVVATGLGGFTESDTVVETMLARQVAAMTRLDYAGLLDEVLARH